MIDIREKIRYQIRMWLGIGVLEKFVFKMVESRTEFYEKIENRVAKSNIKLVNEVEKISNILTLATDKLKQDGDALEAFNSRIQVLEVKANSNKIPWMMVKVDALQEEVLRLKVNMQNISTDLTKVYTTSVPQIGLKTTCGSSALVGSGRDATISTEPVTISLDPGHPYIKSNKPKPRRKK